MRATEGFKVRSASKSNARLGEENVLEKMLEKMFASNPEARLLLARL